MRGTPLPRRRRPLRRYGGAPVLLTAFLTLLLAAPPLVSSTPATPSVSAGAPAPSLRDLQAPVALGAPQQLGNFQDPLPLAAGTPVQATLTLAPRDPEGLENYASGRNPALTSSEVASLFGPTASSEAALRSFLSAEGLSVDAPSNGLLWLVSGSASSFSRAFDTTLVQYGETAGAPSSGGSAVAYASVPRLPADLPGVALSSPDPVGNLRPLVASVAPPSSPGPAEQASACPNASLTPSLVQGAYNITPVLTSGDTGQNERIGIVDAYDTAENTTRIEKDLSAFSSCYHLPAANASIAWPVPGPSNLNSSGSSGWGTEIALDVEWAHATAPNASITLALSPNNAYGLYFSVAWLVALDQVNVISLSWGEPETGIFNLGPCSYECNATTDGTFATLGPVFQSAAAEGIDVFAASGDCGANGGTLGYSAWYPASDPHVLGVGGTYLNLTASGAYRNETAWDGTESFCFNGGGSGGGFSVLPRPGWQAGEGFSRYANTTRGVPDVALVASVPMGIFYNGGGEYVEGTSDAAPEWAGMAALIKEAAPAGSAGASFLGPSLYEILRSPRYSEDFHQVPTGWNGYSAGPGWDPLTGIGTPNFVDLFADLTSGALSGSSGTPTGTMLLSAEPQAGVSPLPVAFQAGALSDPASEPGASYTFYYGDVGPLYGEANASTSGSNQSSFLYPQQAQDNFTSSVEGTYLAFATAFGGDDNVSLSLPVSINVGNAGPLEVSALATPGPAGGLTQIEATAAGGTGPYRFSYFFGDGTYETSWASDGPKIDHIYARNGSYLLSVVANDSSEPMRGGMTTYCVVIGLGAPSCPQVPRTLVDDVGPASNTVIGGSTTMVEVRATFDGLPVPGAQVALSASQGLLVPSSTATDAWGYFFANYTARTVNQSYEVPIFANASAPGYATGLGEALLLVDASTGPSLDPWVRFGQSPATGGSSDGIVIGGLKAFRGLPASNASLTASIVVGGAPSGTITGTLDPSGLYATTWNAPLVPKEEDAVLTLNLTFPGFTSAPFRYLLPLLPLTAPSGARVTLNITPDRTVSMGSVEVALRALNTSGTSSLPLTPAEASLAPQPYGELTAWQSGVLAGSFAMTALFSTTISSSPFGQILLFNISAQPGQWANGSGAILVEVHGGYGPLAFKFYAQPSSFVPGQYGNLTVQASSALFGVPLSRVYVLVTPSAGDPSTSTGNPAYGFTNAWGNLTFRYKAPEANETVTVNVQADGWVYWQYSPSQISQANFTLDVGVATPPCTPPCGGEGSPPSGSTGPPGGGSSTPPSSGSSSSSIVPPGCPPSCPWTAPQLSTGVLAVIVFGLASALLAVFIAFPFRPRGNGPSAHTLTEEERRRLLTGSRPREGPST